MKFNILIKNGYAKAVATENILTGTVIAKLEGIIKSNPNKYTIQIGEDKHIESFSSDPNDILSTWRFINHSCDPNCVIDIIKLEVIAILDINIGDEITFDYNTTEAEIVAPFLCNCGSKKCLKHIRGKKHNASNYLTVKN